MTEEEFDQWLDQHRSARHPVRSFPQAARLPVALTHALLAVARESRDARPSRSPLPVPAPPPLLP